MLIKVLLMVAFGINSNSTVYVPPVPIVMNGAASIGATFALTDDPWSGQNDSDQIVGGSNNLRVTDDPYSSDFPVSGDTPPQS